MKNYEIKTTGTGKIQAALAKLCAQGKVGEPLIRNGASQGAVALFAARLAKAHYEAGRTEEQVAEVFELCSCANASALKQALESCALRWEGSDKDQSVADYWAKMGGGKSAPNLSMLDL